MEFPEHNGWSNEATWSIFANFTRDKETRVSIMNRAQQESSKQVRSFVEMLVHSWFEGAISYRYSDNEAVQCIGHEFILSAMRYVRWAYIYDALRGEPVPEPPNELTGIAYELLSTQNWQEIVEGATYDDIAAVDTLADWFQKHCLTWANIPDGRKTRGLVSKFTLAVMDIYINAVNWDEITEALRSA